VAWLGKLQIAWVFNLCAPLLLARLIGESRRPYAIFNGIVWATVGVANHLLLSRMGSLVFMLTTLAVCLLNLAYWRRWILVMGAAVVGGTLLVANNLRTTIQVAAGFFDRAQNPGIDMRLRLWDDAWRLFLTHPIAGTGIGTFDEMAYRLPDASSNPYFRGTGWHAHNVPLHILSEAGVLGLAAWVCLWAVIIRALLRAWNMGTQVERLFGSAALVSVAAFHLLSMTEVLIGARVHGSLRMNLTVALLVVMGLRMSLRAPAAVDHAKNGSRSGAMLTGSA
jgi:O-antigen ligase